MDGRVLAALAAVLLCASIDAGAGVNKFTAIGPTGGAINKIVFSATPNTVFTIATGGFFRSQDGGVSWQSIKSDFFSGPSDLSIDPTDPNRVYATDTARPALYVSTDGGLTMWASATLPTAITRIHKMGVSHDGSTLYVTMDAQIFGSVDRGQTWLRLSPICPYAGAVVWKMVVDPTDAKSVYVAARISTTNDAILATHDGGITWQQLISVSASTSGLLDLAINPVNPSQLWSARGDGVWVSNDRGVTWTNVYGNVASAIGIDPSNPVVLYLGEPYGQVRRTADAGATWTDVSGNIGAGQVLTVAVNPAQDSRILVGGFTGLAGSNMSGNTWSMQQSGLISSTIGGFSADPTLDRIYINVPSGGIYFTANGAASTTPVNNAGLLQLTGTNNPFFISSMLARAGGLFASQVSGLGRSFDAGNTWSQVVVPPTQSYELFAMASPPSAPLTVLAASSSALYRSTDGGDLWTQITTGVPPNSVVSQLFTAASDPTIAYAFIYLPGAVGIAPTILGVYRSADAGLSWAAANPNPALGPTHTLLAVDPTAANTLYCSTDTALLKSTDGGVTWTPLGWDFTTYHESVNALAIDSAHPNILVASTVARIARSVDGGVSWETLRPQNTLPLWDSFSLIFDPKRPENLLVGTGGSGVQQLTIAPDLALTVAAPPNPVAVGVASVYTYTVSNKGPFDATGVHVRLQLPSTATSVSATAGGGSCALAAAIATCSFDALRANGSGSITLKATAPAAGSFQVIGAVAGDQPDSDATNNGVTSSATVAMLADVSVSAAGTATAHVGDALSYTLSVRNAGPDVASATQLTFRLAAGLTPGSASSTGAVCTTSGSVMTCTLSDLAVATSVAVTVNATAATAGAQSSAAAVTTGATDQVSANNSATTSTTVSTVPPPTVATGKSGGGSLSPWDVPGLSLLLALQVMARQRRAGRRATPPGARPSSSVPGAVKCTGTRPVPAFAFSWAASIMRKEGVAIMPKDVGRAAACWHDEALYGRGGTSGRRQSIHRATRSAALRRYFL
jgi:uncharacterized repeat protein (TIGR01451 family)